VYFVSYYTVNDGSFDVQVLKRRYEKCKNFLELEPYSLYLYELFSKLYMNNEVVGD